MTTDKKDSNVKPLFAGIKIDTEEEVIKPNEDAVNTVKVLLEAFENGKLHSIVFCAQTNDGKIQTGIAGSISNPDIMQNGLRFLEGEFWDLVTWPMYSGVNIQDIVEEYDD